MNIKERIKIMKEKHARQKEVMSLNHGKQLMALYNTCEHNNERNQFLGYDVLKCLTCGYTRRVKRI